MVSDIQNISQAGASRMMTAVAKQPAVNSAESAVPSASSSPKVSTPKPVVLNFDEEKSRDNVKDAVRALNDQMTASKTGLGFAVDESLGRPVVTVRNTQSGEIVRQIPNEVVVRVAHSIDELKGLLLNTTV